MTGRPTAREAAATASSSREAPIFRPNEPFALTTLSVIHIWPELWPGLTFGIGKTAIVPDARRIVVAGPDVFG